MVAAPLSATESLPTALGPGPRHPIRWFPCPPGAPGPRQHGRWVVASCRAPYLTGHSRDLCTHSHPRPKGASENSVFVQCLWLGGSAERSQAGIGWSGGQGLCSGREGLAFPLGIRGAYSMMFLLIKSFQWWGWHRLQCLIRLGPWKSGRLWAPLQSFLKLWG